MKPSSCFRCLLLIMAAFPGICLSQLKPADIDASLAGIYSSQEIAPSEIISDEEFIRRLSLDTRGVIPSIEEVISFLKDENPQKRSDLVTTMMNDSRYGEHWAEYWDKVLVGTLDQPQNATAQFRAKTAWKDWVATFHNENGSYQNFIQSIVAAQGEYPTEPEVFPISRWRQAPASMAGTMSRAFLGLNIQCAQCHDHKDEPELTQEKFWEFASFFTNTRVVLMRNNTMDENRFSVMVRDAGVRWEHKVDDTDLKVEPTYLNGQEAENIVLNAKGEPMSGRDKLTLIKDLREWNRDRRQMRESNTGNPLDMSRQLVDMFPEFQDTRRDQLAAMMMHHDERQLALNFVNRLWSRHFGRGIIDPVDNWISVQEGPQSPTLELIAEEFIRSGFNIKHIDWLILNTQAYQRSISSSTNSALYPDYFVQAQLRPLSPEQFLRSMFQALSIPEKTDGDGLMAFRDQAMFDRYQAQFVSTLGNDEMEWTNTFETSVPKMLFLMNDPGIQKGISRTDGNILERIRSQSDNPEKQIEYLYLSTLSRFPTDDELADLASQLSVEMKVSAKHGKAFQEDLLWALLNSTEFVTNH